MRVGVISVRRAQKTNMSTYALCGILSLSLSPGTPTAAPQFPPNMSATIQRTPNSKATERKSLFFRDLASPISAHRTSRFSTPAQAAAVSAIWRENLSASDNPPPPPVFTLEDRLDFSPEHALHDLPPLSPESAPDPKTPTHVRSYFSTPPPIRTLAAAATAEGGGNGVSGSWWAPRESEAKGRPGSPVDGVVLPRPGAGALIMLPPPMEVARPEMKRNQLVPVSDGMMDDEEWVTVYGFSPGDTNLVLREFEKCGVILKHVTGPREANWMHILYQNRYDARKALGKNGMQLNSVLVIGVKPVDPMQRQCLGERLNNRTHDGGFMLSLPPQSVTGKSAAVNTSAAPTRLQYLQDAGTVINDGGRRSTGAIASPAKSVVSKVMDLMFGF